MGGRVSVSVGVSARAFMRESVSVGVSVVSTNNTSAMQVPCT